jgi:hypothetical protein
MHKFHSNLQVPPLQGLPGANTTSSESNPIMLQALIGTHTQSMSGSKEDGGLMVQAASKKRKKLMNETHSGRAIKEGKSQHLDPLTTRSVNENYNLQG